jgi:hypothetical protein
VAPPSPPVLVTTAVTAITGTTATSGGTITSDGGATVTSRGLVWGTSPGASTFNSTSGAGTGTFSTNLTGLNISTTYYVRAFATNNVATAYGPEVFFTTITPPPPAVGDNYGGGKIFYIFQQGDTGYVAGETHGLIASTSDKTGGSWGCYAASMGTSQLLGTGSANTTKIITGCSASGTAAKIARAVTDGGFSDWYLPSREELTLLYSNRNSVGGFGTGKYYSSSEQAVSGAYYAYYLNFSNGDNTRAQDKNIPSSVRAIRTF